MSKICHVISGYLRDDARINRQCQSLLKDGHEVYLLTNDGLSNEEVKGIKIRVCKTFFKSRFKELLFARWQFSEKIKEINADIYQLHSPELLNLVYFLKKNNKKVIYDAHEDLPNHILEKEWIPLFLRKFISLISILYFHLVLPKLDGIISPHSHVSEKLKEINKASIEISNFPSIKSPKSFDLNNYLSREEIICYAGSVYRYSNQENAIDVVKNIENLKYYVAGHVDQTFKETLEKRANSKNIKYLGRLGKKELSEFLSSSMIGLSIYDYKKNLGDKMGSFATNKLFEYMEAGLPIICTDFKMWKNLIEETNCGVCVEPNNKEELRKAILFLLSDKKTAYEMGQNGRLAVEKKYNWLSQEKKYNHLFNKILNS